MSRHRDRPPTTRPPDGDGFTNGSGAVRYQWVAHLATACGWCLSYNGLISDAPWPIPAHPHCRCTQRVLPPGRAAGPTPTLREIFGTLTPAERARAYGAANAKLIQAGLASPDDVVGVTRVLDFREVVANKGLTFAQLIKAGVPPHVAAEALKHPPLPDHEVAVTLRNEAAAAHKRAQDAADRAAVAARPAPPAPAPEAPAPAPLPLPEVERTLGVRFKEAAYEALGLVREAAAAVKGLVGKLFRRKP